MHFLRKESEWLHERDYGNKAAGQVKPMERDGACGLSVKAYCEQTGIAAKTYYYRLRRLRESAVEQARFEATQPELVQFTPPAEYAVGQAQSIVIKTADTTIEIPVNTQPDVVAAAVSFLRQS